MGRTPRSPNRAPLKPRPAASAQRHVRAVTPVEFPEHLATGDESQHVVDLRIGIWQIVNGAVSPESDALGMHQPVYYRANDPACFLAPDVFVKRNVRHEGLPCWKS